MPKALMYFFRVQTKNIPSKATQVRTFVGSCTFKRDKVQARPRHRFFGLSIRVFDGGVKYIPFKKVFWTEDKRGLSANRQAHTRMTKEQTGLMGSHQHDISDLWVRIRGDILSHAEPINNL